MPTSTGANRRQMVSRYLVGLRTEGQGPVARSAAVALGAFIGCLPIYGLHLAACLIAARALGLNRLLTYFAANISNPLLAPLLTFGELQLGRFLRTGSTYAVTVAQLQTLDLRSMAGDLVIGSIAMGLLVAAVGGTLTFLALKGGDDTGGYAEAAAAAADHYIEEGLWTWEFANQKLRRDPIYRYTLTDAKLPSGGTIVDFGCGLGLALVLLKTAASLHRTVAPPHFQRFAGVEPRPAVAAMAARALGEDGAIVTADGRAFTWPACNVVLFLDVLHLIPFDDQAAVLAAARRSLSDAGVVVVREADASMGWAFRLVRAGNHLRALAGGRFRPRFYFRTADQWNALFQQAGFDATPERHGSPLRANVAFKLVPAARFTLEG